MLASAYVVDVDKTGHSNDNYAYIVKTGYKTGDDRTAYTIWDGEKNVDVVEGFLLCWRSRQGAW